MNRRILPFAVAAAAVLALGDLRAQTLDARLDRNPVHDDETVRLILEAEARTDDARPDLTPLRNDFEVLGQSTEHPRRHRERHPQRAHRVDRRAGPQAFGRFTIVSSEGGND